MSEAELLEAILDLARLTGWHTYHARPARTANGWRTAVQGDGVGFPDLVLVRDRVLAIELKSQRGALSEAQGEWLIRLEKAGIECHVWRPSDIDAAIKVLS